MKIFGISGYAGSGKTRLIERLLPVFRARGLRVAVVKHAQRDIDLDRPGKDSWRHREAGAREVMVVGPTRWALMHELRAEPEPGPDALLSHLAPCDLVLLEGFRDAPLPRLEVRAAAERRPCLHPGMALVQAAPAEPGRQVFDPDAIEAIAAWVLAQAAEFPAAAGQPGERGADPG